MSLTSPINLKSTQGQLLATVMYVEPTMEPKTSPNRTYTGIRTKTCQTWIKTKGTKTQQ